MVSLSLVSVVGLVTALVVRKRRLRAQIDLSQEDEGATGNFEMMNEGSVRV